MPLGLKPTWLHNGVVGHAPKKPSDNYTCLLPQRHHASTNKPNTKTTALPGTLNEACPKGGYTDKESLAEH